jgi:hypothetical protein
MKDQLEQYIEYHKNEFDDHKVDKLKLWKDIDNRLPKKQKETITLWKTTAFRVAASIVLFIGISLSFLIFTQNANTIDVVYIELNEIDSHYKELVNQQVQLIKNSPKLSDEERTDFLSFLNDLDVVYNELKIEIKENVNNQKVLEANINNYKEKIQLMENLLQRTNQTNHNYDEKEYVL